MKKLTLPVVVFCMQFVLWMNLAIAMDYMPSEPIDAAATTHNGQTDFSCELPAQTATAEQSGSEAPPAEMSAPDCGADLCLPAAITSKQILSHMRTPVRNCHTAFSAITSQKARSLRPPKT